MTSRKDDDQHPADDQQIRLIGIADHLKWEAKYKPVLDMAEEKRSKSFDDAEAQRFAIAMDAILRGYQSLRKRGLSRGEAGDELLDRWRRGIGYTLADLHRVLCAIRWKADTQRREANRKRDPDWHRGREGDVA